MADEASLTLKVDSRQVKAGEKSLDDLALAGGRAEKSTAGLSKKILALGAGIVTIQALGAAFSSAVSAAAKFETALVGVSKTTGLIGNDLKKFGDRIDAISRSLPITTQELLGLSQAAGQMGVTGAANLEKFSLVVAKLGRASNLAGEEAATSLARILNITGEHVSSIDTLASVIVALGNSTAASEAEIANITTEVARATSVFGVTSAQASAMAAAMASVGIQAQLGGSSLGRVMQEITNRVQAGGDDLLEFAEVLNINSQMLSSLFKDDKTKALELFLQSVGRLGINAGLALEKVGLGGQEISKTIVPLANNMDIFTRTMALANAEVKNATALDREFDATLKTLDSQWQVTKNTAESYARSLGEVLLPVLNSVLESFNRLTSAKPLSDIERQVKLIEDLRERLKSETNKQHIPLIGGLLFDKKEVDQLSASIEFAIEDLENMRQQLTDVEKAAKPAAKEFNTVEKSINKISETSTIAINKSKQFISDLKREAAQVGKTAAEIRKMQAADLGLLQVAAPLIDSIERETRAFRLQEDQISRAQQITESLATADEKYASTINELNVLLSAGAISQQTFNRALINAQEQTRKLEDITSQATDEVSQLWIQAGRNIQSSLADSIFNFFNDGLKGLIKNVGIAVGRIASQFAALRIAQVSGIAGLAGAAGSAAASTGGGSSFSLASLGSNALSLASSGFGTTGILGSGISGLGAATGSSTLAAFGSGIAGDVIGGVAAGVEAGATGAAAASAASAGASIAAVAGPAIVLFAVNEIFRIFAKDKRLGGVEKVPLIGGILSSLFGRSPLKQKETKLTGQIGAGGFESGQLSTRFKATGGAFRRSKSGTIIVDLITDDILNATGSLAKFADGVAINARDIVKVINQTTVAVSDSFRAVGENLGLSTAGLDDFNHQIELVSENGKALTEEQIGREISNITDELAHSLIPEIDRLSRFGETATEAISRFNDEFNALGQGIINLGGSAALAKTLLGGLSIDERASLVEAGGGINNIISSTSFFSDNFLTEAERIAPVQKQLTDSLTAMGLSADITKEEFKNLVQTNDDLRFRLLSIAPAFIAVIDYTEKLAKAGEKLDDAQKLTDAFNTLKRSVEFERNTITEQHNNKLIEFETKRTALTEAYNLAIEESDKRIKDVSVSVRDLSSLSKLLKSSISSASKLSIESARSQAKTGDLSSPALRDAIAALSKKGRGFTTKLEEQRFNAKNLQILKSLNSVTDAELLLQERTLDALRQIRKNLDSVFNDNIRSLDKLVKASKEGFESEISRLDEILQNSQNQLDALNKIDKSVLSVADALFAFNIAANVPIKGPVPSVQGPVPTVQRPATISDADILEFGRTHSPIEIFNAAQQFGISSARIASTGLATQSEIDKFVRDNNLASFDSGGKTKATGLAVLHKNEQVLNRGETSKIEQNLDAMASAIEVLTITTNETNRRFKKWDGQGMPPIRAA